MHQLERYIREIPDFPKPGVTFRDITTLWKDPKAFCEAIEEMEKKAEGMDFDIVVGIEARGFMFAAPIAYNQKKSLVPIRKKGKLPCDTISETYDLEYDTATIEMHVDAIKKGQRVLIVDDLLATGGTVKAAAKMVERLGGIVVGCVFLAELKGLEGRKKLVDYHVESVISYDGK